MLPLPPGRALEGTWCPRCDQPTLQVRKHALSTTLSGTVTCTTEGCGYRDGLTGFIGKSLFPVQRLPEPNGLLFYLDEPKD